VRCDVGFRINPRPPSPRKVRVPITYSYRLDLVDPIELTDLLRQAAAFAPGQALHSGLGKEALTPDRVRRALRNSLACVAAFAPEGRLSSTQGLAVGDLTKESSDDGKGEGGGVQDGDKGGLDFSAIFSGWFPPARRRRGTSRRPILVGFARAVGDRQLVATVHDVAVLPELRGMGLGTQLVKRLTKSLYDGGITDVGLLAPTAAEGFFERCGFGEDSEGSTAMVLTAAATDALLVIGELGAARARGGDV
jgi:ribosomal protein S18 acetylase RimI-like enzyme